MKNQNITSQDLGSENFKKCTIFKKFSVPIENKSLIEISTLIASDKFKTEIDEIQSLKSEGNLEDAQKRKLQLLAFTPSATFKEKRLHTHIEQYSGIIHLDFDKLRPEELETAFKIISQSPYTILCFRSPSGNGLKVFAEVTIGKDHHDFAFLQVMQYYENLTGLKADDKCKDITRLCFMGYDPNLYKTLNYRKFELTIPAIEAQDHSKTRPKLQDTEEIDYQAILLDCKQFTERKKTYTEGNRNEFIYTFACNCNRNGIPEHIALQFALSNYDLPHNEIIASFHSAYSHHADEFGNFAKSAKLQTEETIQAQEEEEEDDEDEKREHDDDQLPDYLRNTPTIPDEVYEAIPDLLKEGARVFDDKRKRDVFLTGAISIISGCLPNVTGVYFQERVFPHLYAFIIGPPASGKGALKNAKRLIEEYHKEVLKQSDDNKEKYVQEMDDFKHIEHKIKKGQIRPKKPKKPLFKIVIIPADCSKAKLISHLKANEGKGIICESEADTLSSTKKQDWGDYSTILRLAFHHETISISRKNDDQYDEIVEPCLAFALTGTPSQAPRLLSSAEDGLFSRILYYAFKNSIGWQDPSPSGNKIVFNDHFNELSKEVLKMVKHLELYSTKIELKSSQWKIINKEFPKMLSEVVAFTSEDAAAVVFRLGLILFRICMILTALRKFENKITTEVAICTDQDFTTALTLVQTYLQHSLLMFQNLPNQGETIQFKTGDGKRKFFEDLPQEFKRKEAIELGPKFKLSPRTVDEFLKSCLGFTLTKIKAGLYKKN